MKPCSCGQPANAFFSEPDKGIFICGDCYSSQHTKELTFEEKVKLLEKVFRGKVVRTYRNNGRKDYARTSNNNYTGNRKGYYGSVESGEED